jgi:PAS domain-containing protein
MALSHSHKDLEKRVKERCAHFERELNGHRRTRELLSTAVESISDGFALYEADNKLVMCNQMLKKIYQKIAVILVPGTSRGHILRAAIDRGQFQNNSKKRKSFLVKEAFITVMTRGETY